MANRSLFGTKTEARNEAGGMAYALPPEHALAQLACTGTLNHTYYTTAEQQLASVLAFANQCTPSFVAAVAVYARRKGFMKDMPALLLATLAARSVGDPGATQALSLSFPLVIDNGKMMRNFVQIIRSGVTGRKSLGSYPQRLVRQWLAGRRPEQLFRDSVGNDPSLADVIKMVHPKPFDDDRRKLYGYLIGKTPEAGELPQVVLDYEAFKAAGPERHVRKVPDVDFRLLDSLELTPFEWTEVALRAPWHMARMNLNTFLRHDVFKDERTVEVIASRLADPNEIQKARVFPYQLLTTFQNVAEGMPMQIIQALNEAMEHATANVPKFGAGVVCVDTSGSMGQSATGNRLTHKGRAIPASKTRCIDVAALVGACMIRQGSQLLAYDVAVHVPRPGTPLDRGSKASVMQMATILGGFHGGGTASQMPLMAMNEWGTTGIDFVLYVSDNESWVDASARFYGGRTAMMQEWLKFKERNPKAKLVCIDITPGVTVQAPDRDDILNVGGFSDDVFNVVQAFLSDEGPQHWVEVIKQHYKTQLDERRSNH